MLAFAASKSRELVRLSHQNKNSLKSILSLKIFLIENECKTQFLFYQKYFYDKMDLLWLFHFDEAK